MMTRVKRRSAIAALGIAVSVGSQPFQPWRVGFRPSFASQRWNGRCRQFSSRSKYFRIFADDQLASPVSSAMWSQSALCG